MLSLRGASVFLFFDEDIFKCKYKIGKIQVWLYLYAESSARDSAEKENPIKNRNKYFDSDNDAEL